MTPLRLAFVVHEIVHEKNLRSLAAVFYHFFSEVGALVLGFPTNLAVDLKIYGSRKTFKKGWIVSTFADSVD